MSSWPQEWCVITIAGYGLINVEFQADKYAAGLPGGPNPSVHPLPFIYKSTGVETRFINGLDPETKTRSRSQRTPRISTSERHALRRRRKGKK